MKKSERTLILGTRGSRLALIQTESVQRRIQSVLPGWTVERRIIRTEGDRNPHLFLSEIGGKGVFVREMERALLDGSIDLAVHSLKDMPAELPEGLSLGFCPPREDPRDVLVGNPSKAWASPEHHVQGSTFDLSWLPAGARVGTGSLRRTRAMQRWRPDLLCVPLRGNVETRLQKMQDQGLDALLLAAAGLRRMNLSPALSVPLDPERFCPAPAQGLLGIEMRTGDGALREALQPLNDEEALLQRDLERTFLKATGGNCKLPVGAYASLTANQIVFYGFFGREEGSGSVQGKKLWDRNLREETPREQNRRLCQAVADFARELMDQVNAL